MQQKSKRFCTFLHMDVFDVCVQLFTAFEEAVLKLYLGECPKIKDGRHFHGNEAREQNHFFFSMFFILIIINVK